MGDTTGGKLTANQERYVQELVKLKSQRQAYYIAYPKSKKWKVEAVDSEASRTLAIPKVSARYQSMIDKHKEKAIMTRDGLLEGLKRAFEMACGIEPTKTVIKELVDGQAQTIVNRISLKVDLKAISSLAHQIAKLEGWEVDKVEHSGIINSNEVSGMTEEELELEIRKQNDILKRTSNDKAGDISSK